MAKKEAAAPATEGGEQAAAAPAATGAQGTAVVLPNGKRRIDFIRDNYYDTEPPYGHSDEKQKTRSAIRKEINDMLEAAGQKDKQIPYQIVFGATKEKTDPRRKTQQAAAPATA